MKSGRIPNICHYILKNYNAKFIIAILTSVIVGASILLAINRYKNAELDKEKAQFLDDKDDLKSKISNFETTKNDILEQEKNNSIELRKLETEKSILASQKAELNLLIIERKEDSLSKLISKQNSQILSNQKIITLSN